MSKITPFIILGVTLVLFALSLIIFSYILIYGVIVGFILFLIAWVKDKLTVKKNDLAPQKQKQGQVIDHDSP